MTNDKTQPLRWTAADEAKNPAHKAGEVKRDSKGTVRYKRVVAKGENGEPIVSSTISQSKIFNRQAMKEFHPELGEHLKQHFGFDVGIELEDPGDKILSKLEHHDYIEAKKTLRKTAREVKRMEDKRKEIREQTTAELSGLQEIRTTRKATEERVDIMAAVVAKQRAASAAGVCDKRARCREVISECVRFLKKLGIDERLLAQLACEGLCIGLSKGGTMNKVRKVGYKAATKGVNLVFKPSYTQPQKEYSR